MRSVAHTVAGRRIVSAQQGKAGEWEVGLLCLQRVVDMCQCYAQATPLLDGHTGASVRQACWLSLQCWLAPSGVLACRSTFSLAIMARVGLIVLMVDFCEPHVAMHVDRTALF